MRRRWYDWRNDKVLIEYVRGRRPGNVNDKRRRGLREVGPSMYEFTRNGRTNVIVVEVGHEGLE